MAGSNKFLIFDQNKLNIVDDNAYQQSTYRQNGAVTGVAPSTIHNKMFYQSTIMAAAIGQVAANRGFNVSDADFDALVAVLTNVVDNSSSSQNWKASKSYNVGEVIYSSSLSNSMKQMECTVAGTSGTTEPAWGAVGTSIADGTVAWKIYDVRQGTSVGKIPALVDVGGGVAGLPAVDASLLTGLKGIPVGTYIESACANAPTGYLPCDGSAVSRTTYAALFAAIGTTYGVGDGSTTFNVPDRRDRFALAKGSTYSTLGATGGEAAHTLTIAEMPSHNHANGITDGGMNYYISGGSHWVTLSNTGNTGGGAAHNNMPPYITVNIYIKY